MAVMSALGLADIFQSASCLLYPRKQTSTLPHKRTKTEARGKWKRRGVALYGDITVDWVASASSLTSSPVNFVGPLCRANRNSQFSQRNAAVGGNKGATRGKPRLEQQRVCRIAC
jgi:hypothetical protein